MDFSGLTIFARLFPAILRQAQDAAALLDPLRRGSKCFRLLTAKKMVRRSHRTKSKITIFPNKVNEDLLQLSRILLADVTDDLLSSIHRHDLPRKKIRVLVRKQRDRLCNIFERG